MEKRIYMHEAFALDEAQEKLIFDGPVREFFIEEEDILGEGASFTAFSGRDYNGHNVVLKENHLFSEKELWLRKNIYIELRNLTGINVLQIHGIYREEATGRTFISQDRIPGKLYTLQNYPTADLVTELECISSLLETMKKLAEKDYLVLDLKPDNLFRLDGKNELLLFDVDCITTKEDAANRKNIVMNRRYAPQELISEQYAIDERTCTYMACYLLMERLFGEHFQTLQGELLKRSNSVQVKQQFVSNSTANDLTGCSPWLAEKVYDFFAKEWNQMPYERSESIEEMLKNIEELKEQINMERSKASLRTSVESSRNDEMMINTHRIYEILMDYPVYDYCLEEGDLNILLAGGNNIRTQILESVISCVQMLNRKLNIYICGENTINFWRKMEHEKPELRKVIRKWENESPVNTEFDPHLVAKELANVNLYYPRISCRSRKQSDYSAQEVMEKIIIPHNIHYVFAISDQEEKNVELLNRLVEYKEKNQEEQKYFVAYYGRQELDITRIDCKRIPHGELKKGEMFSSYLYRCALQVHNHYKVIINKKRDRQRIQEEFKSDLYYAYASERPVVQMLYTLKSIHMDPFNDVDIAVHYKEALWDDKGNIKDTKMFCQMIWLEHLSWTAYQIMHGNSHATLKELDEYIFQDHNDWKKKLPNGRMKHPCIVSSNMNSYGIKDNMWDDESLMIEDGLDEVSISLYRICKKHAQKNKNHIYACLTEMQEDPDGYRNILLEEADRYYSIGELNISRWNNAWIHYRSSKQSIENKSKLEQLIRPVLQASQKRDFKKSDAGIIRLYELLLQLA